MIHDDNKLNGADERVSLTCGCNPSKRRVPLPPESKVVVKEGQRTPTKKFFLVHSPLT